MIAFEIEVNGVLGGRGGAEDLCVLTAMVTAVGKLGARSQGAKRQENDYSVEVRLGGLTARDDSLTDEHLDWVHEHLKPGDEVTIRIVDSASADAPTSSQTVNTGDRFRQQFEGAKRFYLENRDKFEPEEERDEG